MDFSDIVEQPQTEEAPPPPKKPYWQVLDEYRRTQADVPEIKDMSLTEFANNMNEIKGTQEYDEGLNDSWLRRAGAGIPSALHHLGGASPSWPTALPSLSQALGGPREGVDLPELAGRGGEALARGVGAPEWAVQAAKSGAAALPETALTVGAASAAALVPGGQPFVLPILGGLSGLETYGETGRVLPSLLSAGTAMAIPKAMELGGQAVLGRLGAKTVGELRPDLIARLPKGSVAAEKAAEEFGDQFAPSGLVQRAGRLAGAQTGMLATTKASEAAQIAMEPDKTWEEKLGELGQSFSPTGLVSSAIQQLPFTAMDVFGERTHPMDRLENAVRQHFEDRFVAGWQEKRQTTPGMAELPTRKQVQQAWDYVGLRKPAPGKTTGEVLESLGDIPITPEKDNNPVKATDGEENVQAFVTRTRERANDKLIAQGFEPNLTMAHNPMIQQHVRVAEFSGGTKEDIATKASNSIVDSWLGDQKNVATYDSVNAPKEDPTTARKAIDEEITAAITEGSPTYDKATAQRMALVSGNMSDRIDAGLVDANGNPLQIQIAAQGGGVRPLTNSIVNDKLGRNSSAEELQALDKDIKSLEAEIETEQSQNVLPGFETDLNFSNPRIERLQAELNLKNKQYKEADERAQGHGLLVTGAGESRRATIPTSDATAAMEEAAYNYGKPGTPTAGRVLDVNDPKSVADFYKVVVGKLTQAEQEWLRRGIYGPGQKVRAKETFETESTTGNVLKLKSRAAALARAEELKGSGGKPSNVDYRVADTPEADGLWRVVRMEYPESRSLDVPGKVGEVEPEADELSEEEALAQAASEDEDTTEGLDPQTVAATGADPTQVALEPITAQMFTLSNLGDPATGLGRKAALTQNVVDYVKGMATSEIEGVLKGATGVGIIQQANVLRQRYMRFMQFLRDNGNIHLEVEKLSYTKPRVLHTFTIDENQKALGGGRTPSPEELAARKTLSENYKARLVISKEGGEQLTFTPKGGEPQGLGAPAVTTYKVVVGGEPSGTIRVRGVGDLEGLNRYLQVGDENRPDRSKLGYKNAFRLNQPKTAGLNFFEQFYWLSQKIRQERPDPRIYGEENWMEKRPMGNWQWVPPGFIDDVLKSLVVDWPKEMRAPLAANMAGFPTIHSIEKPGRFKAIDGNGKWHEYPVTVNPLLTLFNKGLKDQLLIPAHELVSLIKRFGGSELLPPNEQAQFAKYMDMAEKLTKQFPFVRNQMVGFGVTKDPYTRALFHTDKTMGSEGILLNPTIPDPAGVKYAKLLRPTEVFPHLLEELAHSGVDFAYKTDKAFASEVKKIFDAVRKHQDFMVKATGGPNVSVYDNMHSLERPEEMLAGMFRDGQLHQLLKGMKDDLGPLPWGAPATGSLWDRIIQMFRNLFEKIWSPEDAGTMLDRMAKTATRALDIQSMMNLENRRGIYQETKVAERLLPKRPTIIERAGKQPVPKPGDVSSNYPYTMAQPRPFTPEEGLRDKESVLADAETKLAYLNGLLAKRVNPVLEVPAPELSVGMKKYYSDSINQYTAEVIRARQDLDLHRASMGLGPSGGEPTLVRPGVKDILEQIGEKGVVPFREQRAAGDVRIRQGAGIQSEVLESRRREGRVIQPPDTSEVLEARKEMENTPEFQMWFRNSKIVDEAGRPLVVYHATPNPTFTTFKRYSHFGTAEQAAKRFTDLSTWTAKVPKGLDSPFATYPVYLDMKNPKRVTDSEANLPYTFPKYIHQGYDGLIYENELEGPGDSYVVFNPVQVKSAIGNKGTFAPYSTDILESRVPVGKVYDALNSATTHTATEGDDVWFKPYDLDYFRNTYGPAFGNKMQLEERGGQWGYKLNQADLGNLTDMDVNRMPVPRFGAWVPSAFETLKAVARRNGSDVPTAEAIASWNLQFAALLRNTEGVTWGLMHPQGDLAGMAWAVDKVAGLTPHAMETLGETLRHEATHTAGFHPLYYKEAPDVQHAYAQVTAEFTKLSPQERSVFLEGLSRLTLQGGWYRAAYPLAVEQPGELAAEFMGFVGNNLMNVPQPSVYLRDVMRFAPDSIANLVKLTALRRTQALHDLHEHVKSQTAGRGLTVSFAPVIENLLKVFNSIARPAIEISIDQAEFYRTRGLYADMYKPLLSSLAENLEYYGKTQTTYKLDQPIPSLKESELLQSREGSIIDGIRDYFTYPTTDGKLPRKLGFWDRTLTQFSQLALKYPIMKPFADMFNVARGMTREAQQKLNSAMAGVFKGDKLIDDARTRDVATFENTPRLRQAWSNVALRMNKLLDTRYDAELGKAQGDKFAIDPQKVTGWLTPAWINGALEKEGVTSSEDKRILQTIFSGTRNQIRSIGELMTRQQIHNYESMIAKAIVTHANIDPEEARKVSQKLSQAVQVQAADPMQGQALLGEVAATIKDPKIFGQMYDIAEKSWEDVLDSERFLSLRQPAYSSERRPGKYGLFWDVGGKIRSQYFENGAARDEYTVKNKIDPTRVTNPTDQTWGVSPALFEQMDVLQKRIAERFTGLFGEQEAQQLSAALDMSTELRSELNSREILRLTTHRELAPGREELDMWDTHRHYLNAMTNAIKNRFIKNEAAMLFAAPEFDMQPNIKSQIQGQIKAMMTPDSPLGTFAQKMGFLYYLFANPSSMIMQMSHQVMGLAPMLTRMGQSVAGSYYTIGKANAMVIEAARSGKIKDAEIDALVKRREREGGIQSWLNREIDHTGDLAITNRLRVTSGQGMMQPFDLLKNRVYQGYRLLRQLYDIIPTYNSKVAFIASVLHLRSSKNLAGKLTGEQLYKEASFMQNNTMYPGGKENRPGFFQYLPRSAAQALWSLQTYANGLTTEMGELIRRSFVKQGMTPAQTKQIRKAAVQMLTAQTAVAGVLGLPFAELMLAAIEKMFPEHDIEGSIRETLAGLLGDDDAMGNSISTSLMTGIPSAMDYAPDVGSRFALHGVFHVSPYHGVGWQELMGPTGGILSNMYDAGQAGLRGEPMQGVQELMPTGFRRIWKSLEQGPTYSTEGGRMLADNLRPEEIVARAIGFGPARIARLQDFERLTKQAEQAEKMGQTGWTKKQVKLLRSGQDEAVQQNIAQRTTEKRGVYPQEQLGGDIAREFERQTTPANLRSFGNRATVLAQKSLRGVLGTQDETPGSLERLQLQQSIAQRLGLRGPTQGAFRHASAVDQLTSLYPNLTDAQANLLLTHASGSRPTPDLYQELLTGGE